MKDQVEKTLEKADRIWENEMINISVLPEPDKDGMVRMRYQDLRQLCHQRHKLGWANGVFHALAAVSLKK